MGLFGKKTKEEKKVSDEELDRRDRLSVSSVAGGAAKRRKDIMDAWKNMCKADGKDWIERLIFIVSRDLDAGGVHVPSSMDQALDSSAAIMSMAEASSQAVTDMANKQIAQIQQTVTASRQYLAEVDTEIAKSESLLAKIRIAIKEENVGLARARQKYIDLLDEAGEAKQPVAPSELPSVPEELPVEPEVPVSEPGESPPKKDLLHGKPVDYHVRSK